MFKVVWDKDNNGVLLTKSADDSEIIAAPRPVYAEELRMLGLNKHFNLPEKNVPVCWEIDRKYYYCGEAIAETKGGNIYIDPTVIVNEEKEGIQLKEINLSKLVDNNMDSISVLENEAMDFIEQKFQEYQKKNSIAGFVAAYSGGKDSQVILDLVSRVLPPEKYTAVFTNTGMELPCTIDLMNITRKYYGEKYHGFSLEEAKNDTPALELWNRYGPPSRMNRWCCSVLKTALFGRKMKELLETKSQPKLIIFEGVRNDESARRASYERVGEGVKHVNLINCRPILKWNTTEVYLYLYKSGVSLNEAYTLGLTRVGCGVCPFASDWSEYVIRKRFPNIASDYIHVIEKMAQNIGISQQTKIDEYISTGNWKKNAGGKGLQQDNSRIDVITKDPDYECIVQNPKTEWRKWFSTIGEYFVEQANDVSHIKHGELKFEKEIYKFEIEENESSLKFKMPGTHNKVMLTSYITKAFTKSAYCEKCGVCEIECPTGALTVRDTIEIDTKKCVNCHNCFGINNKGCIIATRRLVYEGGNKMGTTTKTSGIDRYSTFGLRSEWLTSFFNQEDEWFDGYAGLGPKQIPAMLNWLREAGLVELKEKKVTKLEQILKPYYNSNPLLVWQIIWINLAFNSAIVNWYTIQIQNNVPLSKQELVEYLQEQYPNIKGATLKNPIDALVNMFDNSPLGSEYEYDESSLCLGVLTKQGIQVKTIGKCGTNKISSIAIAYLLYKNAELNDMYELTVSDIYEKKCMGPYNVFNMEIDSFLNALRGLTNMEILSADLLGGLDNIHLSKEMSSEFVLEKTLKSI